MGFAKIGVFGFSKNLFSKEIFFLIIKYSQLKPKSEMGGIFKYHKWWVGLLLIKRFFGLVFGV